MTENLYNANEAEIPAPSASLKSGDVIVHAVLGSCVVQGLRTPTAIGQPLSVRHSKGPTVRIASASATTFAANAAVNYDAGLAVTSGGVVAGKALIAKTSGMLHVDVVVGA
ncbi:hypothetical protein K227x_64310 [Rubripirellula lacrimiformis]|uniref:DUF2190 family protein n=1 Tax=Rubripirellula lacrimiformis TaxID=1930273 RepID=A0A517NLJ2_9BACT|nr:hypothetical protein [Rubripirellula lacrimiformis]QDT08001.1 hypothetical protein K227x_64310 [Rubripirellula lacrimiformis]